MHQTFKGMWFYFLKCVINANGSAFLEDTTRT